MKVSVDASVLLAIALNEQDAETFADRILNSSLRFMSPVNYWEALVRIQALRGPLGVKVIDELIAEFEIQIVPVTAEHARVAAGAFARFGKGHPARLNLGDCFAYSLSKIEDATLIFKGNDFTRTDISR